MCYVTIVLQFPLKDRPASEGSFPLIWKIPLQSRFNQRSGLFTADIVTLQSAPLIQLVNWTVASVPEAAVLDEEKNWKADGNVKIDLRCFSFSAEDRLAW